MVASPAGPSPVRQRLRRRAHAVTLLLAATYGSPTHNNKPDPLDELVYIVLSQMTTQPSVSRVFDRFNRRVGSWERLLSMPTASVARMIHDAGLSSQKAPRIQAIMRRLQHDFGRVSLDELRGMSDEAAIEYLCSLPGVGPKTARCVMMYSLGRSVLPVDTHVSRVSRRLGLLPAGAPSGGAHEILESVVAPGDRYDYHVNALAHGRSVCLSGRPRCDGCPISRLCPYPGSVHA